MSTHPQSCMIRYISDIKDHKIDTKQNIFSIFQIILLSIIPA